MTHDERYLAENDSIAEMEALGRSGLTISVCCGPSGVESFRWSVNVLSRDGQEFDQPFAALSFEHAIAIAKREIRLRSWGRGWDTAKMAEERES
jgi:hypothetical protein